MLLIFVILGLFPIIGCQQEAGQEMLATSPPKLESTPAIARKKGAKPGAPVSLASANMVAVSENKTSDIVVLLKAQAASGIIHVELKSSEGLQLMSSVETRDIHLNTDGYYHVTARVLAVNNGRYYLKLHVTIDNGEYSSSRVLAVIVQVGPLAEDSQSPSQMLKSNNSENVISLPAQENINR